MRPWRWIAVAGGAGVLAAGAAYVASHDPHEIGRFPQCPFHVLTGLHCPGCGSTRALHALLHGDLGQACGQNLLFVALLPVLAVVGAVATGRWLRPEAEPRWRTPRGTARVLLWLVIGFTVLRNLPVPVGTFLAPD